MLKYRLLLGPVLIVALIATLWVDQWLDGVAMPDALSRLWPDHPETFPAGLAMLVVGIGLVALASRELGAMLEAGGVTASRRWMTAAAVGGLLVCVAVPSKASPVHAVALVATVGAAFLVIALIWHVRDRETQGATEAAGAVMLAFVYLGLMFGFLLAIRREHSAWVVLGVLVVTKSCDIGAYFTGRAIGRHKLIPWLSPGKTWEGLFGGIALATLVCLGGLVLAREHAQMPGMQHVASLPLWYAVVIGVLFACVGQVGDLLESVLKRDAGVKDSGRTLPGFGGVLDVLDSVLLVAPVAFWTLTGW